MITRSCRYPLFFFCLTFGFALFAFTSHLFAQEAAALRETIFGQIDVAMKEAREKHADLFSPTSFEKAEAAYKEATRLYDRKERLTKVQEKLNRVDEELKTAMKNVEIAKLFFENVMKARSDALRINAPTHAASQYNKASQTLRDAALKVEDGDVEAAKKKAATAEKQFRDAELIALRVTTLGNAQNLIRSAQSVEADKYAPQSYGKAKKLLDEIEQTLKSTLSAGREVQEKVEQAEYYARLAIYLTKQTDAIQDDSKLYERIYLGLSDSLQMIAAEWNITASMDSGLARPLHTLLLAVRSLKQEKQSLEQEKQSLEQEKRSLGADLADRNRKIADQEKRIDELTKTIIAVKGEAQALAEKETARAQALVEKEKFAAKIREVEGMFTQAEGTVLRKENSLIMSLHGLAFPAGKADITPQQSGLLAKVQKAITAFPDAKIAIGGHTDSAGNSKRNKALSEKRANAVRDYLIKAMGLDESRITAAGYGSSTPVAPNDTEAGRAKNRRIEIILSF